MFFYNIEIENGRFLGALKDIKEPFIHDEKKQDIFFMMRRRGESFPIKESRKKKNMNIE